jgi:hypothetical protein
MGRAAPSSSAAASSAAASSATGDVDPMFDDLPTPPSNVDATGGKRTVQGGSVGTSKGKQKLVQRKECVHNRLRCKECSGGIMCEHGRQRSQCKDCGGSQICEHKRIRSKCPDCGGSQICEHKRIRSQCPDCNCRHNIPRGSCSECDRSEAQRMSKRKRKQRKKERQNGISAPEEPLVDALFEKREQVTGFLRNHSGLLPLLQESKLVSVIDTGASQHRWNKGVNASRSRKGADISKFAVYSVRNKEWFYMWLKGGDENRNNVQAHVRKWKAGDYGKKKSDGSFVTTFDKAMTEKEAQLLFVDFVKGTTVLEYGSCYTSVDAMRIISWLKIYPENAHHAAEVKFFNLGMGVCFTTWNCRSEVLFGPRGIVQTPDATISWLDSQMFEYKGSKSSLMRPSMTEVTSKASSDEPLDVQRLYNVFMVLVDLIK